MAPREVIAGSYDRLAEEYEQHVAGELAHKPYDRALLDDFAERTAGRGRVADVGCGPGHVAAYLHGRGADVCGVDLSPGMIERARQRHPAIPFQVGDVLTLPFPDGAWVGAVAFYSLIHLPRNEMANALRELVRVVRPGGAILLSFHVGEGVLHLDTLWDVAAPLDFAFFTPSEMHGYCRAAGLAIERCDERDPYPDVEAQTRRCYIVATVPAISPPLTSPADEA